MIKLEQELSDGKCTLDLRDYYAHSLAEMGFELEHVQKTLDTHNGDFQLALGALLRQMN